MILQLRMTWTAERVILACREFEDKEAFNVMVKTYEDIAKYEKL